MSTHIGDATGTGAVESCTVVPLQRFLRKRYRGNKTNLCIFLLNISKGSKYRYSPAFFSTRTFDQLVDFCVRLVDGVGDSVIP